MQQSTNSTKRINQFLFKTPYIYGIFALIFIGLIPFISGETESMGYYFEGTFLDILCLGYLAFIVVGAIKHLLDIRKYGKLMVIKLSRFYSWILFFICVLLFCFFIDQSFEMYFEGTFILHAIVCIVGVIVNMFTVIKNEEIKPDTAKIVHYFLCFLIAFVGLILSINTMDNINYSAYFGGWAPSIVLFGVVIAISSHKIMVPISHKDYIILSNRAITLKREIRFPQLLSSPSIFLLVAGISLFIERRVFQSAMLTYYEGGFVDFLSFCIPIIAIGLLAHLSRYNKTQTSYIAQRNEEEKKEREATKKVNAPAQTKTPTSAEQKYFPWFMPRQTKKFSFNNELTFKQLAEDFIEYSNDCGLYLRDEDVRSIFASLAISNFIVFNGKSKQLIDKIIEIIAGFFGSDLYVQEETKKWMDVGWIVESADPKERVSELVKGIYLANVRKDNISVLEFNDVVFSNFDRYFAEVLSQACNKNTKNKLTLKTKNKVREETFVKDGKMQIPKNLIFAINLAQGETLENATGAITECTTIVNIDDYSFEDINVVPNSKNLLSYRHFRVLVESAWDEFYASENVWRKIDKVGDYLKEKFDIKIDNPSAIAFEKYIAVYLALGGNEDDAVDHLMSSVMLHKYSYIVADMLSEDVDGVYSAVDNAFGIDNVPHTDEYIKLFRLAKAESDVPQIIKKDSLEYEEFVSKSEQSEEAQDFSAVSEIQDFSEDSENESEITAGEEQKEETSGLDDLLGGIGATPERNEESQEETSVLDDLLGGISATPKTNVKPQEETSILDDLLGGSKTQTQPANFGENIEIKSSDFNGGRNVENEEKVNDLLSDMLFTGEDEEGDK